VVDGVNAAAEAAAAEEKPLGQERGGVDTPQQSFRRARTSFFLRIRYQAIIFKLYSCIRYIYASIIYIRAYRFTKDVRWFSLSSLFAAAASARLVFC
jgi:hypothetical protein